MHWFRVCHLSTRLSAGLAQKYLWGLGQSVVHSRRSLHSDLNRHYTGRRDLHCTRRGGLSGGRVAQGLPGSPVPRATGKEVQGTVSPRRRGWGAPVLGSQAWGRELSQGLGSHRGNGSRFGPGVRTGGSGEARTRVHRRESGLTSAGAAGTQRGRGRESPGRRERADD